MSEQAPFAIGMIETQGLTAVIEAIDTACKAGNVEILGREKLGGGYITVLIKGASVEHLRLLDAVGSLHPLVERGHVFTRLPEAVAHALTHVAVRTPR